jgi:hypothetical protein
MVVYYIYISSADIASFMVRHLGATDAYTRIFWLMLGLLSQIFGGGARIFPCRSAENVVLHVDSA